MPYIPEEDRVRIDTERRPAVSGELNYALARIIDLYLIDHGGATYHGYNEVVGVLECLKLELYRRFVSVYEDKKLFENGEVFFHYYPRRIKLPHV